ncbi:MULTISPECIES: hypothetical protein [unclassified Caballeronia]|uniref:hypothetical protein n=1 Tax=unclassified Caballeronia TaxID=2646786 RepID=UPI002028335E|nr:MULTISPECIES: hypothetical protein [unclassified Caballeronia]
MFALNPHFVAPDATRTCILSIFNNRDATHKLRASAPEGFITARRLAAQRKAA